MNYILEITLHISGYGEVCLRSEHESMNKAAQADSIFRECIKKWKKNKDLELRCDDAENVTSDWDRFIILRGSLCGVKIKIKPGSLLADTTATTVTNTYNYRGIQMDAANPMADAVHEDLDPT